MENPGIRPDAEKRRSGRRARRRLSRMVSRVDLYPRVEIATAVVAVVIGLASYAIVTGVRAPAAGLPPSLVTVLLVANLTPLMVLITLIARRLALLRSEEHTSELQSLMRISYAVFCLKKKKQTRHTQKP